MEDKKPKNVEDLEVFKLSHESALEVYKVTGRFPKEETYGLAQQMRRAAVSVPSNIAEGANRYGKTEYGRFVSIAKGSAGEIYYQLLLARDLGYLTPDDFVRLRGGYLRVLQMLQKLIKSLKTNIV
ncbi:MAG: four helix bundle protein [Deltaproteobacteria bacterium]|nr:four helix bundle protein [Deltaproteobacteria bacterium]